MFYIRTEKNIYDLDVVIDVSDNKNFVETSGLSWIEIDQEESPIIGTYYYENKFILIDSEDYKIIEDLIFEFEEPNRIEREEYDRKMLEEYLAKMQEELENSESSQLPPAPEPISLETIKEQIKDLPKPEAKPIENVESIQENYELWAVNIKNLDITINAYDSGKYTFEDGVITFDSPVEFPDGNIVEQAILPPSTSVEEQIKYLKEHRNYVSELIERIKTDLEITD